MTQNQEACTDDQNALTFEERQKIHFARLLREKWECDIPGHTVCVPTEDKQHFQLSDKHIKAWAQEVCRGGASTSQPPESILLSINEGAVWNRTDGSQVVRAVSIAPSRRRGSLRTGSSMSTSRSSGSRGSSTIPGLGYVSGKVLKWLGASAICAVEDAFIMKRANRRIDRLKQWEKSDTKIGTEERTKLFEMLGDALVMSLPCYPPRINNAAYAIGREVQRWLHWHPDILQTRENAKLLLWIQICLLPLLLTRISSVDPLAGDLAWKLLEILNRVPLTLQGPDTTSAVVRIILKELAYSRCAFEYSWLGLDLLRIIETTLRMRRLTDEEMSAIHDLVIRRQAKRGIDDREESSRPWEVALFALCVSQNPCFKEVVLGPPGLVSLLSALDRMLAGNISTENVAWEPVALTLRSLAFLSEHEWFVSAVEPEIVVSLLKVFRRDIPKQWFCTRFWAMDTIRNIVSRNIVSRRPEFVRTLIQQDAVAAFATLTMAALARDKGNSRTLEDYKKEATKRAEDLSYYIKRFNEWTPDALPVLEPVSLGHAFIVDQ